VRLASLRLLALATALFAGGCFDSLVGGECQDGFAQDGSRCVAINPDASDLPDAADGMIDPDAADAMIDPDARDGAPRDARDGGDVDASVDAGPNDPDANVDAGPNDPDANVDAGPNDPDANVDAGPNDPDASVDAGPNDPDARVDAGGGGGADAGVDAGPNDPDASVDAGGGGGADAGVDAGPNDPDASVDADGGGGADASVDADPSAPDAGVDAGPNDPDASVDATLPVDALVCDPPLTECFGECVDTETDPDNCGACGTVCGTGLCEMGECVGETVGHVVLIGHDYSTWRTAQARVLGNAVALAPGNPIRVVFYRGNAASGFLEQVSGAITSGLGSSGRTWEFVVANTDDELRDLLRTNSALIVLPQDGDGSAIEATGAASQVQLNQFLARGGSIVVLEGTRGQSHKFLVGAQLLAVTGPMSITNQTVSVFAPTDAVATSVPTPYRAESRSVSFTLSNGTHVVVDSLFRPVVVHLTVD
jgi:hypothetical protein